MLNETVSIDIQVNFLYSGMILKGDAFDENGALVLERDHPVDLKLIEKLKKEQVKTIHYKRERLKLKKDVSISMVSDKNMEMAMGVIDELESNLRNNSKGIPAKEINELVGNIVSDIKNNEDAYLNLLDLYHFQDYTYTHSINVATISILLGVSLNLDEEALNFIGTAALLHDIGKTMISNDILDKPDKLNEDEWHVVKSHPVFGYDILRAEKLFDKRIEQAVLFHHETYKGGGYPFGANYEKLGNIPQILSIADVFDALTSKRPHKESWSINDAFTFMMENSGIKFNPQITQVFLRDMVKKINEESLYPEKSFVILNTGEIAYVVGYRKSIFSLRPIINIFFNPHKGIEPSQQFLKYTQQIDLEQDFSRSIIKKVLDEKIISKFKTILKDKETAFR